LSLYSGIVLLQRVFKRRCGLATGIGLSGGGVGTIIFGWGIPLATQRLGLQGTLRVFALLVACGNAAAGCMFTAAGLPPLGGVPEGDTEDSVQNPAADPQSLEQGVAVRTTVDVEGDEATLESDGEELPRTHSKEVSNEGLGCAGQGLSQGSGKPQEQEPPAPASGGGSVDAATRSSSFHASSTHRLAATAFASTTFSSPPRLSASALSWLPSFRSSSIDVSLSARGLSRPKSCLGRGGSSVDRAQRDTIDTAVDSTLTLAQEVAQELDLGMVSPHPHTARLETHEPQGHVIITVKEVKNAFCDGLKDQGALPDFFDHASQNTQNTQHNMQSCDSTRATDALAEPRRNRARVAARALAQRCMQIMCVERELLLAYVGVFVASVGLYTPIVFVLEFAEKYGTLSGAEKSMLVSFSGFGVKVVKVLTKPLLSRH